MCSSCDSSVYFQTTYSQDERIATSLKHDRHDQQHDEELEEEVRRLKFEEIDNLRDEVIFQLPGLDFLKFTSTKIKFSFKPCELVKYVSKKVIFHCSLVYLRKYRAWKLKRDSFPGNYKWSIYKMFYKEDFFAVADDDVTGTICRIYEKLFEWAQNDCEFRRKKFSRYLKGEEVYLDDDDEEMFLTDEEREELYRKRRNILKRMLPPGSKRTKRRRRYTLIL